MLNCRVDFLKNCFLLISYADVQHGLHNSNTFFLKCMANVALGLIIKIGTPWQDFLLINGHQGNLLHCEILVFLPMHFAIQ